MNKTKLIFTILTMLVALPSISSAKKGGRDGGGGDSLKCNFLNQGDKYYAYDYILSDDGGDKINPEFLKPILAKDRAAAIVESKEGAKEILKTIANALRAKIPKLADGLEAFTQGLGNTNRFDAKAKWVWINGTNLPADLQKRSMKREIPLQCRNSLGDPNIIQTVIRQDFGQVEFTFTQNLLDNLALTAPIQLSFLYIHEWLRDYVQDEDVIMNINRMLHEIDWLKASGFEVRTVFEKSGLDGVVDMKTIEELAESAIREARLQEIIARISKSRKSFYLAAAEVAAMPCNEKGSDLLWAQKMNSFYIETSEYMHNIESATNEIFHLAPALSTLWMAEGWNIAGDVSHAKIYAAKCGPKFPEYAK